jgi:simple sugar transport system permease protein
MGFGVARAVRARIFNIGAKGQFQIGAATRAALAAPLAGLPTALALPILLAAGAVGGAIWGAVAGVLRARFNTSEIIATMMLDHIAFNVPSWLFRGPLRESAGVFPRTDRLPAELRLPVLIDGTCISAGLLVVLVAVVLMLALMARSRFGLQIAALAENPEAARHGGVAPGMVKFAGLAISGRVAGLAGIVEL